MVEGVSVITVVDLHGCWRFFAILCRFSISFFLFVADYAMCVAHLVPEMNASSGETLKIIQNRAWKDPKSSKINPRGVSEVLGALGSVNAERRADKDEKWSGFGGI